MKGHKVFTFIIAVLVFGCAPGARPNGSGPDGGSNAGSNGSGSNGGPCLDQDGDGWTTCQGDCCDNTTQCANPALVNPGAIEVNGDGIDNDCDGHVDNAILSCDQGV